MQCREALVVLLLSLSVLGAVHGDESYDFVRTKQEEVRTIALAAQDNYAKTCETVRTCLSPQNCSRLECFPLPDQRSETTCVYVNDNKWCTNRTGAQCNNVEANFVRGYVRTPQLDISSAQEREIYLGSSICTQRNLDPTFVSVSNKLKSNSSVNYFYNLYFGAVDGSFRYYPGRELLGADCGNYDPRIRPWYTGAISVLKDLVILVDTGTAMQQNSNFLDPTTSFLETAASMIKFLVQTLTQGDRVTVLPVNGSGSYPGQTYAQYNVPPSDALDPTAPGFQGLLSYINGATVAGVGENGSGAPTNFRDGFVQANAIFSRSSPTYSMKIVILFTNSQSNNIPDSGDRSAADELKNSGSQVFVYDLNPRSSSWESTYGCRDGESQVLFSVDPLLFLSSYFSFLASARIAANDGRATPFWQNPYDDASDLGTVITVAYPAMSPDGQLIGVAGIDVQLAGLDSDPLLRTGVETLLSSSPDHFISTNENASNIAICQTAYRNNCSGITPGSTISLCSPATEQLASDDVLRSLLCCKDCRPGSSSHVAIWVSVGVLSGLLALLALAVMVVFVWSKRRRAARQRQGLALNDYSYDVLRKATNGFATKNIIGKGSFGTVYKAVLGNQTVAVKQLSQPADRAEDFEAEIRILGLTSHPNLVELKGTCFQPTQCFLVYELVDSGDLHSWLWPAAEDSGRACGSDGEYWTKQFLSWNKRRKIARGVARGLNYLHRGLQPNGTVFHLDIKPHNILLQFDFNPKIADFGISQLYEPGYTFKVASVVRGTFGYIAPEVLHGQVKPNSKLDVYSYGMVLLQLVSGRKIDDPEVKPFLLQWAKTHADDGYVERVVDENLVGTVQEEYRDALMANCKQLIMLALRCLSERPELRPEMSEVLECIDSLRDALDVETPPTTDDDASFSADHERSTTDAKLKTAKSTSRRLLPSLAERQESPNPLSSESSKAGEVGSMAINPEIAPSVSPPVNAAKGRDNLKGTSTGLQDESGTLSRSLSRSSADDSFQNDSVHNALHMPSMVVEPRSRPLRRSVSS